MAELTPSQKMKLKEVLEDPVKWAQAFLITWNGDKKCYSPWTARWYQAEMLRDKSKKKVYRCGRRTGKTETMVVESLYSIYKNPNYRVLIITPYQNQVDLAFKRINELVDASPALKSRVVRNTKNPYQIEFNNHSSILGFTTGASSGSGGASIRGQRADLLILDEVDYMNDADFDSVMIIAGERNDIRTIMSSTPTGRRAKFYEACVNKDLGFIEHFHPSMHNPNWCEQMEAEFRASLTASGYVHEVEAEFGVQDTGVFDKTQLDRARTFFNYAYNPLDYYQEKEIENGLKQQPQMFLYDEYNPAPFNRFRTMGIDWDKYSSSSSIVILEYNVKFQQFMILKRFEMPRAEYSYDNAVNTVIELNNIYKPAWIYADRGSGEYQIERLHIYGDEHPESGLKNKLKGWQFANKIDIYDPITGEKEAKPMKPFMVNQLQLAFERGNMILSPWDDTIYTQLINYEVEKITASGIPTFTSKDEHFIDALGLAYLAMVLEFKKLTGIMQDFETASEIKLMTNMHLTGANAFAGENARKQVPQEVKEFFENTDFREIRGERQSWVKLDSCQGAMNPTEKYSNSTTGRSNWGSRGGGLGGGGFTRRGW